MSAEELWAFVDMPGFGGDTLAWAEECVVLCSEYGCQPQRGADFESFSRLVDDAVDGGYNASGSELAISLDRASGCCPLPPLPPPISPAADIPTLVREHKRLEGDIAEQARINAEVEKAVFARAWG